MTTAARLEVGSIALSLAQAARRLRVVGLSAHAEDVEGIVDSLASLYEESDLDDEAEGGDGEDDR